MDVAHMRRRCGTEKAQRAVQRAVQRWRSVGAEGGADLVAAGVLQVPEEVRTARAEEEARLANLILARRDADRVDDGAHEVAGRHAHDVIRQLALEALVDLDKRDAAWVAP